MRDQKPTAPLDRGQAAQVLESLPGDPTTEGNDKPPFDLVEYRLLQIEAAVRLLLILRRVKIPSTSASLLKHLAEDSAGIYVTEVVVLGVAVAAGIEVRGDMVAVSYAQASAMRHGRRERRRHDS